MGIDVPGHGSSFDTPLMNAEAHVLLQEANLPINEKKQYIDLFKRAVRDDDLTTVKYLVKEGMDVEFLDNYAIKEASERGYLGLVRYLCEQKADVNAQYGISIIKASRESHFEVMDCLIEFGASTDQVTNNILYEYNKYKEKRDRDIFEQKIINSENEFQAEKVIVCSAIANVKSKKIPKIKFSKDR